MKNVIKEFADYLEIERGVSASTAGSYCRDVKLFLSKMNIRSAEECCALDEKQVQAYIDNMLAAENKSESTVLRCGASLRNFYGFLVEKGGIDRNIADDLALPQLHHKDPVILTPAEVNKLLQAPKTTDPKGARDKAMLELLYATGMKVTELINIEVADVNTDEGVVSCRSGGKSRVIPMGTAAEDAVAYYLENIRDMMVTDKHVKALFVNCSGNPMSRQGFWKLIKGYIEEAGIEKHVTPQTLRHSFAVHLLQNGADADSVSKMLGYSDSVSTRVYSNMLQEKIKKVYNRTHPRA